MITIHQRHRRTDGRTDGRQTDRQTTCDRNTALCTKVHRAVKTATDRQKSQNERTADEDYTGRYDCEAELLGIEFRSRVEV